MCGDPGQHLRLQFPRPGTVGLQGGQVNEHIDVAPNQVDVRWTMVALAQLKPVLAAKTMFGCHEPMV